MKLLKLELFFTQLYECMAILLVFTPLTIGLLNVCSGSQYFLRLYVVQMAMRMFATIKYQFSLWSTNSWIRSSMLHLVYNALRWKVVK